MLVLLGAVVHAVGVVVAAAIALLGWTFAGLMQTWCVLRHAPRCYTHVDSAADVAWPVDRIWICVRATRVRKGVVYQTGLIVK